MLPPFMGTRNNHSPPRRSFAFHKSLPNVNSPRHTNTTPEYADKNPQQCGPHYLASGKYHANGPQWETKKQDQFSSFHGWKKKHLFRIQNLPCCCSSILVGGWTNPFEEYARQNGNLPQIGVKSKKQWYHVIIIFQLLFIYTLLFNQFGFCTLDTHPHKTNGLGTWKSSRIDKEYHLRGVQTSWSVPSKLVGHGWATKCKIMVYIYI